MLIFSGPEFAKIAAYRVCIGPLFPGLTTMTHNRHHATDVPAAKAPHGDNAEHHAKPADDARHSLSLEAFAPPKKTEHKDNKPEHKDDKPEHKEGKDHELETFKQKSAGYHKVVMHLSHHQAKKSEAEPDVEVKSDGSLKWHDKKPSAGHSHDKEKTLVVAFSTDDGSKEGNLSHKQTERLKQLVDTLEDSKTHTEVDKKLQEKAQLHIIPTDKQDKVQRNVLVHATRHGEHDPANGHWSGGNGSLYRHGQSHKLVEPPATARHHLGSEDKDESEFIESVSPTDRPQIKDFVDKLVWAISGNEGNYTTLNPNDAGHGISIGIRQWNQKSGELPTLLRSWHDKDPEKFNAIFGQYSSSLLNERFVRGTTFAHQPGLLDDIRKALADKEFQQVQLDLARQFVVHSVKLGYQAGFRSELALADIADVINQCGPGGFERAMRRGMKNSGSEKNSVLTMERVLHRPNGMQRLSALSKTFSPATAAQVMTG